MIPSPPPNALALIERSVTTFIELGDKIFEFNPKTNTANGH